MLIWRNACVRLVQSAWLFSTDHEKLLLPTVCPVPVRLSLWETRVHAETFPCCFCCSCNDFCYTSQTHCILLELLLVFVLLLLLLWGARTAQSVYQLDYGLDDRGAEVRFPVKVKYFALLRNVQTSSRTHTAPYTMVSGHIAAGAWSWPLTSIYCRG
jgi:hypothetical protein